MPGRNLDAETEQGEAGPSRSGEGVLEPSLGVEYRSLGGGDGAEASGDGVVDEGREDGDMRGTVVRGGDSEQGSEGVQRGNGTRGDDTVECVLSVSGSEGTRSGDQGQRVDQDSASDAE